MPGRWSEGFRPAQEMLPVLRTLLSQLGSEQRAVRLLGVSVSSLMPAEVCCKVISPGTNTLGGKLILSRYSGLEKC